MQALQKKIFEGQHLTQQESLELFSQLISGKTDPILISAYLIALKIKGEQPSEVVGAAQALRQHANPFPKPDYAITDSCGTGGSGQHTLNISTLVSLIASVKGLKMVKHGNRSISSKCGSADVLEQLNVKIDMSPEVARRCLDEIGTTFLFAPLYHTGVKHVMPVRNTLKTRTIFNLLGPLINPANPEYQLMGVYAPEYCYAAAESLRLSGCRAAMVVHSCGCDEITLAGTTHVAELKNGKIEEYDLNYTDFGLNKVPLEALVGGTPEENAQNFTDVLQGKASNSVIDTISANAGALFYLSGKSESIKQGVSDAKQIIVQGDAFEKLQSLAEISHQGAK
ncbi:anthranilate phosphoribosyltransferase [Aliikangiella sp. IMCC44359]|uniref:anthranilate phosphoribosyltransferase n=1 Tax=Aliikangiella sp. IMCC44359 TaxID=3459125 RepID=UPI00403AEA9A